MDKAKALRKAILNSKPPYCAGTLALDPEDLLIYYGKRDCETHGRIDFNDTNNKQLRHLAKTCDKATFGRGQEDVLDESYRKAGKLDTSEFSTKLDPERSGLIDIVRYNLLEGHASTTPIKAELYKLNVYGENSFFKAHKDTPRSTQMFGSLVIVLPTRHEGGALILRHKSKEWTFDPGKEIGETKKIGYIAFFSDVEHEVSLVRSGYRVTLTYNLYYIDESQLRMSKPLPSLPLNENVVKQALRALVEESTFYPEGTHLGFGLRHEYPIATKPDKMDTLDFIFKNLKGSDAVLKEACEELGLDARLYVLYSVDVHDGESDIIVPNVVDLGDDHFMEEDESFCDLLLGRPGARVIYRNGEDNEPEDDDLEVVWITDKTSYNIQKASWMAYGNEYWRKHTYGELCLIVTLDPSEQRSARRLRRC